MKRAVSLRAFPACISARAARKQNRRISLLPGTRPRRIPPLRHSLGCGIAVALTFVLTACAGCRTPWTDASADPVSRVCFVGDSLTARMDADALFPGLDCCNFGVNGDTVAGVSARIDAVCEAEPDCLVLLIGINDLAQGMTADAYLSQMDALLADFSARLPESRLLLESLYPVNSKLNPRLSRALCDTVSTCNAELQKLADKHGFRFADVHNALCEAGSTLLNPSYTADGLHINEAGYAVVAQQLSPYFA